MTRRQTFRQADVSRALKGAKGAGLEILRVEIDQTGKIVIVSGQAVTDALDHHAAWKAKRDAREAQRRQ